MTRFIVAAIAAMLVLPAAARADVTVNTQADIDDGACQAPPVGDCSLRDALDDTLAGELIILPAGTYDLNQELFVEQDGTIRGAGARTTTIRYANPNQVGRVMTVGPGVTFSMSGVRVTGGNDSGSLGGGMVVSSGATLNLSDSSVDGNTGDRGGGIWVAGTLNLERTLIARNHAVGAETDPVGGGIEIASGGVGTLTSTTVSGNTAFDPAATDDRGGGIYTSGNLNLHNVTIAENSAGDGSFGVGGGLYQRFGSNTDLRTVATNTLVARNIGFNCGGTDVNAPDNTVAHPIQSTNGVSDELSQPSCNTTGLNNQLVEETELGGLAGNGGPTDTHALLTGSPGIDKGAPGSCPETDQRGISRPRGAGCDVGAYEVVPTQSGSPPDDEEAQPLPPPVPHKNVNALPKSGTVKVKLPGSDEFVELTDGQQIPLGTIVDTRKGRVTIVAASGDGQTADFYDGLFKLSQTKGKKPITVLTLIEKLSCSKKQASAAAKKKKKRRLWGDGKGRFRTKGKHSAATVVGTKWLVEDRCTSTLTRVVRGKVRVRDFVKKKTVLVKAGKKYVARARR